MSRVLQVAWRDFVATAMTKGFILGAFVLPAVLMAVMLVGFKYLLKHEAPEVEGTLLVADPTGRVLEELAERLRPEAIAARTRQEFRELARQGREELGDTRVGRAVGAAVEAGVDAAAARVPRITVTPLDAEADLEAEKERLRDASGAPGEPLALAAIDHDAVERPVEASGPYGGFQLYVRPKLDDRVQSEIRDAIAAAVKHQRLLAAGLDPARIERLVHVRAPRTREVTAEGERAALGELRQFVPFGFMLLLMVSVMLGGQYLLTTTVEEKSSRVVEVLLSALSPMELMAGKILGQLGVGLSILLIYGGLGGGGLLLFGLADLVGPASVAYLLVFFLIAYVTVGALMAAVGAAVNDIREAQSLQGPVMIALIIPYVLWLPISRDPNSTFSTICSFLPPINSFVMMLRVTSVEPPPTWQVLGAIGVGIVGAYAAVWAAAKVFRIGLLMFGKPPNFLTLLRWVRMA